MKASVKTLRNFLDLLGLVLARRYGPAFAVAAGNEVLSEIETSCDPDYFVGETGLLLRSGVTDYALADSIRHIKGVYEVPAGEVVPDRNHAFIHQILSGKLRLEEPITLSEDDDITGTVPTSSADKTVLYDNTAGKLDTALEDDALTSRLVRVIHAPGASQTVEYAILKGNTVADYTADVNGELTALAAAGDTYLITSNFLIIEHQRYLSRLTVDTSVVDIPQDFENLFRAGLTWKYHLQADSLSKETRTWGETYAGLTENFRVDTTKTRGTSIRNSGRSMPRLFT